MGLTRAECAVMTDGALQVSIDGRRTRLRHDWDKGRPGSIADVYDLALMLAESVVRGYAVRGVLLPDQLELFRTDASGRWLERRPSL